MNPDSMQGGCDALSGSLNELGKRDFIVGAT